MKKQNDIRVLLVDDHQIVLDGIQLMLDHADGIECVGTVLSAKEALSTLRNKSVDVVLLDIEMPEMNGIECCKLIHQRFSDIKVIALTMMIERSVIQSMLEAGAQGYLLKNTSQDELIRAIQLVHHGSTYYSGEVSQKILQENPGESSKNSFPRISRREKEILKLIIDERTTNEIAAQLFISAGTVETHRRNIMKKLGARNTAGIVRIVIENKLL